MLLLLTRHYYNWRTIFATQDEENDRLHISEIMGHGEITYTDGDPNGITGYNGVRLENGQLTDPLVLWTAKIAREVFDAPGLTKTLSIYFALLKIEVE